MKFPQFYLPPMFVITCAFFALLQGVSGERIIAEKFGRSLWPAQQGCRDLQLNLTAQSITTDQKLYLFGNINSYTGPEILLDIEILIGSIDLKTAFTVDDYEVEWRTCQNFTYEFAFLSGNESLLTFAGEQRTKYNVVNVTQSLITYEPSSYGLETIEWPSTLHEHSLPFYAMAVVNVPEWKMTYYAGAQPTTSEDSYPNELFAYNYSTGSMERYSAPSKYWAAASFVPAGEKGMLVMLGGVERSDLATPLMMDEIHVYDIASRSWYLQSTTGKTPSPRTHVCAVVTPAQDRTSYQIHVYGGNRPDDTDYAPVIDNYYILSIPQFVWTKGPSIPEPRTWAGCNLLGKHRMAITAGTLELDAGCVDLIKILDLNTGNLTESFGLQDESAYLVPSPVLADIGGRPEGGATLNYPLNGLVAGLAEAYEIRYELLPDVIVIVDPQPSGNSSITPRKTPVGAIIGGTLGGVAVGAILLGLFVYCRRQRSKQTEDGHEVATHETPAPPYMSPAYTDPTYTTPGSPTYTMPGSPTPAYTTPNYQTGIDEGDRFGGIEVMSSPMHELPTKDHEVLAKR